MKFPSSGTEETHFFLRFSSNYDYSDFMALLRFSFLILFLCHFHLICLFFFHLLELLFNLFLLVIFVLFFWYNNVPRPGFEPGSPHVFLERHSKNCVFHCRKCGMIGRTTLPGHKYEPEGTFIHPLHGLVG